MEYRYIQCAITVMFQRTCESPETPFKVFQPVVPYIEMDIYNTPEIRNWKHFWYLLSEKVSYLMNSKQSLLLDQIM